MDFRFLFCSILQFFSLLLLKKYKLLISMKSQKSMKSLSVQIDNHLQEHQTMKSPLFRRSQCSTTKSTSHHHNRYGSLGKVAGDTESSKHIKKESQSHWYDQSEKKRREEKTKQEEKGTKKRNRQPSLIDDKNEQQRRKQLDSLVLQKIIGQVKKFFIQENFLWDFKQLNYGQLIKLLYTLKYVRYPEEQVFHKRGETQELKKIYHFWLILLNNNCFSLLNFLIVIASIQNLEFDPSSIFFSMNQLERQLQQLQFPVQQESKCDPKYIFFLKRLQPCKNQQGNLVLHPQDKQRISSYFQSFKLNKLKYSVIPDCNPFQQEEQETPFVSKKSSELAESKRKKIRQSMRASNPKIENIDLLDLLAYRQRDYETKTPKNQHKKTYYQIKSKPLKQINKETEHLSKPKPYQEEKTFDQIKYEREKSQFTFHPKVHPYKGQVKVQKGPKIKNVEKVLLRMKEARQMKEEKQNIKQKGWTQKQSQKSILKIKVKEKTMKTNESSNECMETAPEIPVNNPSQGNENLKKTEQPQKKSSRYEVSKDLLRIPILYIDVNIQEGRKERIVIYDNDRANDLANQFGSKHKLSKETIDRLEVMLQQQMDSILSRIEEQTDEESSFIC